MLQPWNDKSILAPPINTFICKNDIDIRMLKYVLKNMVNILSKQSHLHSESAIFSRLLYKFDKKFRNDIGYRSFKKVNCALRKYLALNLLKDVEQFTSVLPNEETNPYYLPTRQMLEYVLLRIIAFSKLMIRVVVCSKQAAVFFLDRVKRGENHWMSLMPYAVLSRLWSMAFVLLQHSCNWYQQLHPFLSELQLKGLNFLPANYTLPVVLGDWLDIKNINSFGRLEWSKKEIINVASLQMDNDVDDFENILDYVNQINEDHDETEKSDQTTINIKLRPTNITTAPIQLVDQGEKISRDSFEKMIGKTIFTTSNVTEQKRQNETYFHVIDYVTNKNTLEQFINNEEAFRNDGNSRSLTNHLSFMQWQSLKNALLRLDSLTGSNRKLQRRFQKIWQQKCLEA